MHFQQGLANVDIGKWAFWLIWGYRFSQDQFFSTSDPRSRGRHYASEAMQLLHQVMIVPSLETVQASIILGNYLGGEGDNRGKHIYIGIARIHAESIRLSEVPVHSTIAVKEEYRRTWLAVCIADRWSSADIGIQYALAGRKLSNFPAIDDVSFHLSSEELLIETEVLDWEHSMWVQMAGTFTIFSSINDVLRNLSHSSLSFTDYRHKVPILEKELYEWEHGLPQKLVYSIDNLNYFIDKGLGRTFLAMHIGLHHFRQILFYPFLDPRFYESTNKSREDRLAFDESAQTCKESARMVSEIAKIGFNSRGCELRYFLHGHIVVISSCIHLHTLLFNEDSNEVATARELLVSNFQLLMRMKLHWRVVDSSLARLRSFQNDCRISRSRPFVLDNWMLRFLMEHTTVLADRQTDVQQPHSRPLSPIIDQSNVTGRFTVQEQSQQNLEEHDDASPPWQTLNNLLNETNTTNDDLVDNALEWLLEN